MDYNKFLGVTYLLIRDILEQLYLTQEIIPEVYVEQTTNGEPELTGVRVFAIGQNYVIFNQVASPGVGLFLVRLDQIVSIDLPG